MDTLGAGSVPADDPTLEKWHRVWENRLHDEAVEALNSAGWPVGHIVRCERDEVIFVSPAGVPHIAEVEPYSNAGITKPRICGVREWTVGSD